jgi:acetylornithine deacetylase/succinyl-diaminopimelate desuccinylase-like protein
MVVTALPRRDEAVRHLQELLRFDTTNPPGNETPAAEYLASVLRQAGYQPVVLESAPGRGSIVARYAGDGSLPPLLLFGHLDVVLAESAHWTHAPFSGDAVAGDIWGRGALDMKSMVAQELMVMLLLRAEGIPLRRDVIFAATADEEAGGEDGMGYLVRQHPDLVRAEFALSEGGGTTMYLAGKPVYDIRTAEKGTSRFRLRATGSPGHGSIPRPDTPVAQIATAVHKLAITQLPFRATTTVSRYFESMGALLGIPHRARRLTETHLQQMLAMLPADLGMYLQAITHDTAVPTGLRAGHKINVIPSEAEALVDGRYLPGQTAEGYFRDIRRVIGDEVEIEPLDCSLPLEDPPGGPLYDTIVSVMGRAAPDATVVPSMLTGATDAKHVARLGTRCLGFSPLHVPHGFPIEHLVHGHDERIPIDGYVWGIGVLHEIVRAFCQ